MYYPGEEPKATAVTARANHVHDGRFGGGSIYCNHWAVDILCSVADQNEEKMKEALGNEKADINTKVSGGVRGAPYTFEENGLYDATSPHQNYVFETVCLGDTLLVRANDCMLPLAFSPPSIFDTTVLFCQHLALRNKRPKAALMLLALEADPIADNDCVPPESIGKLWEVSIRIEKVLMCGVTCGMFM
jgi:hypothetical protein